MNQQKEKATTLHKVLTVIGTVLCIILIPILIINCILIVKSFTSDEVPSVAGTLPLIVLTDSMYPEIESGDLIICHTEEPENIQVGDVIAFFDPAGNGSSIVTHRVIEVTEKDGKIAWRTKGDNNNTEDRLAVTEDKLVAVYEGTRLAGFGNVALFMQTTPGLIVCVVCPMLLLVGYDMLRRRLYEKSNKQDTDQLMAELEELRRMKAEKEKQEKNQ
jgi:signal peptidase